MFTVCLYNFGFMKHFDLLDEAKAYAKECGFECAIIGPDNELIEKVSAV